MAADKSVRAWEGAYRHYGRTWEMKARARKGGPSGSAGDGCGVLGGGGGVAADRGYQHPAVVDVGRP